jgi:hypothetical protein
MWRGVRRDGQQKAAEHIVSLAAEIAEDRYSLMPLDVPASIFCNSGSRPPIA